MDFISFLRQDLTDNKDVRCLSSTYSEFEFIGFKEVKTHDVIYVLAFVDAQKLDKTNYILLRDKFRDISLDLPKNHSLKLRNWGVIVGLLGFVFQSESPDKTISKLNGCFDKVRIVPWVIDLEFSKIYTHSNPISWRPPMFLLRNPIIPGLIYTFPGLNYFESQVKTYKRIFLDMNKMPLHKPLSVTTILFLSADPTDASRLRLGEELREIQEKLLKLAKLRDSFRLELPQLSIRPEDIIQALLDTQPQIVHFSGHGTSKGELCFEDKLGKTHLIQPDALATLFEQFTGQVSCVLLNACYSEVQAKAIAKHIDYVIGMNQAIGDKAAIAFAIGFYQALGAGRTIEEAHKFGCIQIQLQNIPQHLTPVLIKKK